MKLSKLLKLGMMVAGIALMANAECIKAQDGNSENIVVTPPDMINVKVVDENGNEIEGLNVNMKDSENNMVAKWLSGSNEMTNSYNSGIKNDTEKFGLTVGFIANLSGNDTLDYIVDESNMAYSNSSSMLYFGEGDSKTYTVYSNDYSYGQMTVEANNVAIYVNDTMADNTTYSNTLFLEDKTYNISPLAGTVTNVSLQEGEYEFRCYMERKDTAGICDVTAYSTSKTYIKKKIHIQSLVKYAINGNQIQQSEGVFDLTNKSDNFKITVSVVDGSVINIVEPDEDGYVYIYISEGTKTVDVNIAMDIKKMVEY